MNDFQELASKLAAYAQTTFANLATEWTLYQAIIIALCLGAGSLLARWLTPPLEERLRGLTQQPGLMRLLVVPLRKLNWILAAVLLSGVAIFMQEVTWPSRSFLVALAAQLVSAWVVISIASRIIRNRDVARLIATIAWGMLALHLTGQLGNVARLLDSASMTFGVTRISLLHIVNGGLAVGLLTWLAFIAADFAENRLRRSKSLTPTFQVLAAKLLRAFLLIGAVLTGLSAIGFDLTALTVFSGALGIGLGFGLQKIASNLVSGVIILLDKSIKPGDVISVGDTFGWITSLQSRYVSVNTRDGVEHLIPNETLISESVINWSHSNRQVRLDLTFGTSYDADPHVVRKLVVEAAKGVARVLPEPRPVCHITGFGDSSVDYVLRFWIRDPESGTTNVRGDAYLAVWDTFKANGISIPYPQRDVLIREPVRVELARMEE